MSATEYHPLFTPEPDDDDYPAVELSGINIARVVPGRSKPVPHVRRMGPDELRDRESIAKMFGAGEYLIWGCRLYAGPNGEPANSFAKGHKKTIVIGGEHGAWKGMIPDTPENQRAQNGAAPNGMNGAPAPVQGAAPVAGALAINGMPPPGAFSDPVYMMMWMNQQREERESRMASEQRAREDRLAAEAREREDRAMQRSEAAAQRNQELMIQLFSRPQADPVGGIGQVAATLAETFGRIHAPPAPPAAPAHTLKDSIEEMKAIGEASKLFKGNDEIELLKAGASVLQGLGGLNLSGGGGGGAAGGGMTGAPAPG